MMAQGINIFKSLDNNDNIITKTRAIEMQDRKLHHHHMIKQQSTNLHDTKIEEESSGMLKQSIFPDMKIK